MLASTEFPNVAAELKRRILINLAIAAKRKYKVDFLFVLDS